MSDTHLVTAAVAFMQLIDKTMREHGYKPRKKP